MKNRTITLGVVIFCLTIAPFGEALPQAPNVQEAAKRFKLKSEPELGMKLPFKRRSTSLIMTGSADFEPAYDVEHKGLEFTVCTYGD